MSDSQEILQLLRALTPANVDPNGKWPVGALGYVSCGNTVHIRHVPMYEPCIVTVLAGRKLVFEAAGPIVVTTGQTITVPAPASYDIRNEPDPVSGKYRALIVPFKREQLQATMQLHALNGHASATRPATCHFKRDPLLLASISHYLAAADNQALLNHRLMEILLQLHSLDPRLGAYVYDHGNWGNRVRALVAEDLAHPWEIQEICARLATTESTLRRNLTKENTGFRELLHDLRLSTALMQLLQTQHPINRIAYDCGYQSMSRFSNNFHKRFGLPPSQFRETMRDTEHHLNVSEQLPRA